MPTSASVPARRPRRRHAARALAAALALATAGGCVVNGRNRGDGYIALAIDGAMIGGGALALATNDDNALIDVQSPLGAILLVAGGLGALVTTVNLLTAEPLPADDRVAPPRIDPRPPQRTIQTPEPDRPADR